MLFRLGWGLLFWLYLVGLAYFGIFSLLKARQGLLMNVRTLDTTSLLNLASWGSTQLSPLARWRTRLHTALILLSNVLGWPLLLTDIIRGARLGAAGMTSDQISSYTVLYPGLRFKYGMLLGLLVGVGVWSGLTGITPNSYAQFVLGALLVSVILGLAGNIVQPGAFVRTIRIAQVNTVIYFITTGALLLVALIVNLTLIGQWSGILSPGIESFFIVARSLFTFDLWRDLSRVGDLRAFDILVSVSSLVFSVSVLGVVLGGLFGAMKLTNEDIMLKAERLYFVGDYKEMLAWLERVPPTERTVMINQLMCMAHAALGHADKVWQIAGRVAIAERGENQHDVMANLVSGIATFNGAPPRATRALLDHWLAQKPDDGRFAIAMITLLNRYWSFSQVDDLDLSTMPISAATRRLDANEYAQARALLQQASPTDPYGRFILNLLWMRAVLNDPAEPRQTSNEKVIVHLAAMLDAAEHSVNEYQALLIMSSLLSLQGDNIFPSALQPRCIDVLRKLRRGVSNDHPVLSSSLPLIDRAMANTPRLARAR